MRNGIKGARYLKFAGDLTLVLGASAFLIGLISGGIDLAGIWYKVTFGTAVFIIGLFGFHASVRLYSFFRKPTIVRGRIALKSHETRYEMDTESGGGYECKGHDYIIRVGGTDLKISREIYNWVSLGDNTAITFYPHTGDITWVDDEAAAKRKTAIAYLLEARYDKAISDYSSAIRLNRINWPSYYNRGQSYAAMGKYSLAIADYIAALSAHRMSTHHFSTTDSDYFRQEDEIGLGTMEEQADIYYHKGLAYAEINKHSRALADYAKALTLFPQFWPELYFARARTYAALGNKAEAIRDYKTSIERSHDQEQIAQVRERIDELQQ